MTNFTVTTLADEVDPNDGQLSLREAIALANADTSADSISFGSLTGTIYLGAQLAINHAMTIVGPGITLSAKANAAEAVASHRVLDINAAGGANADGSVYAVNLNGLTIQDGRDLSQFGTGGGIRTFDVNHAAGAAFRSFRTHHP
jgi:CSLREA domain-containing protein